MRRAVAAYGTKFAPITLPDITRHTTPDGNATTMLSPPPDAVEEFVDGAGMHARDDGADRAQEVGVRAAGDGDAGLLRVLNRRCVHPSGHPSTDRLDPVEVVHNAGKTNLHGALQHAAVETDIPGRMARYPQAGIPLDGGEDLLRGRVRGHVLCPAPTLADVPVVEVEEVVAVEEVEEDGGALGAVELDPGDDHGTVRAVPEFTYPRDLVVVGDRGSAPMPSGMFGDLSNGRSDV